MTITVSEDMTTDEPAPQTCSVGDCPNKVKIKSLGLCGMHYRRLLRTGTTDPNPNLVTNKGMSCSVEGCDTPAKTKGMCVMHYHRLYSGNKVGTAAPQRGLPLYERTMRLVDASAGPQACHPWTGRLINGMPTMSDGKRGSRTTRSARRVIAEHAGLVEESADQRRWIKMRSTCDPLCCNAEHMEATDTGRPGTRKDT